MTAESPLTLAVRSKASPGLGRPGGCFDVEVVEHLQVVGDEPAGAHDHPTERTALAQVVDHREDVGADPRFGCPPGRLPGDRPVGRFVQAQPVGHRHGGRTELIGIRVAGVDDALRQRVGGEQDVDRPPGRRQHRGASFGEIVGEEPDEGRLGGPTLDADHRHGLAGAGRAPGEVLADRVRGEMWCQHQADDGLGTLLDGGRRGDLDLGVGVLHAERHHEAPGIELVERTLQRVTLSLGDLGERRHAADRHVSGGEVGERLRGGRSAAPDVGVVRLDLARIARRSVRHEDDRDRRAHARDLTIDSRCSRARNRRRPAARPDRHRAEPRARD